MQNLPPAIAGYLEAYNRKDVDGMLLHLTDDVAFSNLSGGQLTAQATNKDAFREMAAIGVLAFESRVQLVKNAITVADITAVQIDYSAVVATDLPNGWRKGQTLNFAGASLFRLRDGQIASIVDES